MPPTADNSVVGLRTSVSLTAPSQHVLHDKTMRQFTMMSGDTSGHADFSSHHHFEDRQKNSKYDFFYKEQCLYSHKVYSNAAKVFSSLKHESREEQENPYFRRRQSAENGLTNSKTRLVPALDFEDDTEKRLTFELAFETLKCKYRNTSTIIFFLCVFSFLANQ